MKIQKAFFLVVACTILFISYSVQNPSVASEVEDEKFYLAYNVWFENLQRVYSINYSKGNFIPAGSEISKPLFEAGFVNFHSTYIGAPAKIQFMSKFHVGMTGADFAGRLVTTETFDELTAGMTESEIEGIRSGRLMDGMSKKAVIMLYGYPPEHRTPSLESRIWTYWSSRFISFAVRFDENERVMLQE